MASQTKRCVHMRTEVLYAAMYRGLPRPSFNALEFVLKGGIAGWGCGHGNVGLACVLWGC